MYYVELIEDDSHENLIDVLYFCSASCYTEQTGKDATGHAMPTAEETSYDVYCANDNHRFFLLWRGLESGEDVDKS